MSAKFDVIVIGGGPGGTPAAMQLAAQGKSVLLVEGSGKLGGACLFSGCIPSKIIRHGANKLADERKELNKGTWSTEDRAKAWGQIKNTMKTILNRRSEGAGQMVRGMPNITFVAGLAHFDSNTAVTIENKETGEKNSYTFDNLIIATGANSFIPSFKGNGLEDVWVSETLFIQERLPESLLIVGGGPIGIEIGQMLSKLGVKCTIIEVMDSILSGVVEPEFVGAIETHLKNSDIKIYTSAKVQEINKRDGHFEVSFSDEKQSGHTEKFENVLLVTGKVPNIDDLNLESTDIKYSRKGINVDGYLETSVKGIYATGDVTTGPKFAHTATYDAHIAVNNILMGNSQQTNFSINSWVLFSDPEIAAAGLTEAQSILAGYDTTVGTYDYKIDAAAQVVGNPFGILKYVVDKKTMRILGIHILQNSAATLSGEAALIVANHLTLMDVAQTIHPHPTLTEAFGALAYKMMEQIKKG